MPSPLTPRLAAALLGLVCTALPAAAADLAEDWGGPPPPRYGYDRGPPAAYGPPPPRFDAPPPPCRVIVRRRFDPYGDEVVRRVRVCDEPHRGFGPPSAFGPARGYGPPREDGPPHGDGPPRGFGPPDEPGPPWRGPRW